MLAFMQCVLLVLLITIITICDKYIQMFKYICHTQVWIGSIDFSDTETKSLVQVSHILVSKTPSCLEDGNDYRKSKGFDFATFTLCGADEFS